MSVLARVTPLFLVISTGEEHLQKTTEVIGISFLLKEKPIQADAPTAAFGQHRPALKQLQRQ